MSATIRQTFTILVGLIAAIWATAQASDGGRTAETTTLLVIGVLMMLIGATAQERRHG
jgi:hypothetical protein